MSAPVWQYFTMSALFSVAFVFNLIGVAAVALTDRKIMTSGDYRTASGLFFRTLISGFMMYVSYSLYAWYGGPLGLGIVLAHWASVISTFLYSLSIAGRKVEFTIGKAAWGAFYTGGMLMALIVYGLTCL